MKKYIAIVGLPGSGKTAAADFFRLHNCAILRFGDQTDVGLAELGLPRTEENERMYREKIRRDLGMAAMAIKIEPRIKQAETNSDIIVLDGMRSWEEYQHLRKKYPQLIVLSIYASPNVRYERLRKRSVRPLTPVESRNRDQSEIENLNSGGPIAMADYVITNEGTRGDFEEALRIFLKSI